MLLEYNSFAVLLSALFPLEKNGGWKGAEERVGPNRNVPKNCSHLQRKNHLLNLSIILHAIHCAQFTPPSMAVIRLPLPFCQPSSVDFLYGLIDYPKILDENNSADCSIARPLTAGRGERRDDDDSNGNVVRRSDGAWEFSAMANENGKNG